MQKGFSGILILVVVALLAVGGYIYHQGNTKPNPLTNSTITSQPSTDTSSPSTTTTPQTEQWQKYISGELVSGLSITYPKGWVVRYRKEYALSSDYSAKYRLHFDFAPADWKSPDSVDWMGWGSMSFEVYDPQSDINQWLNKNLPTYKDGLATKEDTKIGGKPTFLVSSDGKKDWSVGWIPRDVVLGNDYSYEVGYSQNGEQDFVSILKKEVFPSIHIN